MAELLEAASHLPSATGLRAHTYTAVCGLLAVTGMRSSALVGLATTTRSISQADCSPCAPASFASHAGCRCI